MNILFISKDCIALNLSRVLQEESHSVKLYIENKRSSRNFDNIVPKVDSWEGQLDWVGKDGLIVFDDVGFGKDQDKLRKQGYNVFGGSASGDKLEMNREFGQKIFKECGLKTTELHDFENIDDAVCFIKKNPSPWVVKHDGHDSKFMTYIGVFDDGRDVISILKNYFQNPFVNRNSVTLHKKITGIEIGVGRYFNGHEWVGPIEINVEHTKMFPGDMGPVTTEMGTLAWYDCDEKNKLFVDVLNKMKSYLQKIDFRGDFEINCIVNKDGAYPLEVTSRLGSPIIHIHTALHDSNWGQFLLAVAQGKNYNLKCKKEFGIVNLLAVPPFPYGSQNSKDTLYGVNIFFNNLSEKEMKSVALEEVSLRKHGLGSGLYYISNDDGYVAYTTGVGKTISEARKKSLDVAKKIIIPKVFYRDDIGERFEIEELPKLKKWGYIK
ncbi:MAG: hypothetical protein WCO30_00345 [bacterium]